jgi:hypothetical protein
MQVQALRYGAHTELHTAFPRLWPRRCASCAGWARSGWPARPPSRPRTGGSPRSCHCGHAGMIFCGSCRRRLVALRDGHASDLRSESRPGIRESWAALAVWALRFAGPESCRARGRGNRDRDRPAATEEPLRPRGAPTERPTWQDPHHDQRDSAGPSGQPARKARLATCPRCCLRSPNRAEDVAVSGAIPDVPSGPTLWLGLVAARLQAARALGEPAHHARVRIWPMSALVDRRKVRGP